MLSIRSFTARLVVCTALILSPVSFAQKSTFSEKPLATKKLVALNKKKSSLKIKKTAKPSNGQWSAAPRKKTVGVAALGGYAYSGAAFGLNSWLNAGSHFQLGIKAVQAKGEAQAVGGRKDIKEYIMLKTTESGIESKFFLASFFISTGVSYNIVKGDYGFASEFESKNYRVTSPFTSQVVSGQISLGNIWRLDNGLIIGAEWLGISPVLYSKTHVDIDSVNESTSLAKDDDKGEDTDAIQAETDKMADKALRKASFYKALIFNIGYNF